MPAAAKLTPEQLEAQQRASLLRACPRCLANDQREVRRTVGHRCTNDSPCQGCGGMLMVTIVTLDARGSLSVCEPCATCKRKREHPDAD